MLKVIDVFRIVPFTVLFGLVYSALRLIFVKCKMAVSKSMRKEILMGLFFCYLFALFALVWTPEPFWADVYNGDFWASKVQMFTGEYTNNRTVYRCLFGDLKGNFHEIFMLLANVALFTPLGFFLPVVYRRLKWWQVMLIGFGATCIIELVQPVFGRTGDVDDIIANTVGAVIGCAAAELVLRVMKSKSADKK